MLMRSPFSDPSRGPVRCGCLPTPGCLDGTECGCGGDRAVGGFLDIADAGLELAEDLGVPGAGLARKGLDKVDELADKRAQSRRKQKQQQARRREQAGAQRIADRRRYILAELRKASRSGAAACGRRRQELKREDRGSLKIWTRAFMDEALKACGANLAPVEQRTQRRNRHDNPRNLPAPPAPFWTTGKKIAAALAATAAAVGVGVAVRGKG